MKSSVCWENKFFSVGMIVFLMFLISACTPGNGPSPPSRIAPTITSADSTVFTVGTAGTFTVTAIGDPTPTFVLAGALPSGVTFNDTTGVLSGTPAAGSSSVYPLTITASNGVSPDATQNFTLSVYSAPVITSANNKVFTEGIAGTFTVTATGTPPPTFALTGDTLPSGVTFDSVTGVLSGIPDTGTNGTYSLTITASNGVFPNATQSFTLVVSIPTVLIVQGSSPYSGVVPNLTSIMNAAGLTVTTSVNVPSSLSSYIQIWDIRWQGSTPLTAGDITNYTTYLGGGGTLVLIGENNFSNANRNNSIISLISSLGGGSITVSDSCIDQTVQSPFNIPSSVTTVPFSLIDPACTANPGTGTFITKGSDNNGSAIYYARGTLSGAAAGRLMVVFDVNWMEGTRGADFQSLINNMVRLP